MLEHLHQRAVAILAPAQTATLSTFGPADIQADLFPCEAVDIYLYLRVPRTSDHLLNLEDNPEAVITTPEWQLRGRARVVPHPDLPRDLKLLNAPGLEWEDVICVEPQRLQIRPSECCENYETIEFDV